MNSATARGQVLVLNCLDSALTESSYMWLELPLHVAWASYTLSRPHIKNGITTLISNMINAFNQANQRQPQNTVPTQGGTKEGQMSLNQEAPWPPPPRPVN